MQVKSGCFLQHLYLDEACGLLSVRNAAALAECFQLLDVHLQRCLRAHCFPDLQFYCFLCYVTDLIKDQIMLLFDLLDQNARRRICFSEFYTVACILLFLFNIQKEELETIFKDFDISGDEKFLEKLQSKERP
ncbi:PREDICTED: EF-hand calcium-binding domain-containing protein 9 [Chlamydotis macqueenii]|uniref:EF-hand calcium-binding domain-containing protein 9 n=1 Tax=Chlamydotis macqueenii TaxID=187382 RepID=UPI000529DF71|nr:PREDICTED: EF-hand calcium-binding domain-containing protein 9 [Chlamydotis macqueenii]